MQASALTFARQRHAIMGSIQVVVNRRTGPGLQFRQWALHGFPGDCQLVKWFVQCLPGVRYSWHEPTIHQPLQEPPLSGRDDQQWCLALLPLCATRRNDVMRGNLHGLYRQAMSRWAVAPGGCTPGVTASCCPPRGPRAGTRDLEPGLSYFWGL
jgi:hypothetical protein